MFGLNQLHDQSQPHSHKAKMPRLWKWSALGLFGLGLSSILATPAIAKPNYKPFNNGVSIEKH